MTGILVLGATSAIAQATCRLLASEDAAFLLVARNPDRLEAVASDLRVRGAGRVEVAVADLDDTAAHEQLAGAAEATLGGLDLVILAQGALGDPEQYRVDPAAATQVLATNLVAPVSLLTAIARRMRDRGTGCIVGISSVAGDRGRAANYVYGAAKAGLTAFLSGLRGWLLRSGVHVVTVKPGFVDSPMTAHLPRSRLVASPETAARGIVRAIERRRDVVYVPFFWTLIMLVIRLIPERVFKRLSI